MNLNHLEQLNTYSWQVRPHGNMRVPAVIFADEQLIRDMDDKVYEQACNVAMLPGIVSASYAMPDAHWDLVAILRRICGFYSYQCWLDSLLAPLR